MIDVNKISNKLYGVVGFRQPFNTAYAKIDTDNQTSRSGLFITDNEFCKVEYIYDSQDYKDVSDANFNLYLARKQKESIINVCNSVFDNAKFRERNLFFRNAQNKVNTETLNNNTFVGYRLIPNCENNLGLLIKRVILNFQGTDTITLYLYSSEQKSALFTKEVEITSDNQSIDLDWILDNTINYGGEYYLGYYYNDALNVLPYKRDYRLSNVRIYFNDFDYFPIEVSSTDTDLFDLTTVNNVSLSNGLNFDITTYDSYTDLILNNEQLFAKAINLDLQISCLSTYLSSLRSNANERQSDRTALKILTEIEGQSGENAINVVGLRTQLFRAISSIKKEIKTLQQGYFGDLLFTDTLC
jgi:hypothetical protein